MENRHGLIVNACATAAIGTRTRSRAIMLLTGSRRRTLGADKNYDVASFVALVRAAGITPHGAEGSSSRRSTIGPRDMPGI